MSQEIEGAIFLILVGAGIISLIIAHDKNQHK